MAFVTSESENLSVVDASRIRVKNAFDTGLPIYLNVSGGKDSICMMDIVHNLILEKSVDPQQLTVIFADEEAMFEDVIEIVHEWRKRFMLEGAKFDWFCLEFKHFSCLNGLRGDETFITWDRRKRSVWVREMPSFAIKEHDLMVPRKDNYQAFFDKYTRGGIKLVGVRTAESIQRLDNMAKSNYYKYKRQGKPNKNKIVLPIYDWKNTDVWLYIKNNELKFPATYMRLYSAGEPRQRMRISQFFSMDTARVLVRLAEHAPHLMDKVLRREPNAYLASLYWDTEMFRGRGRQKQADTEDMKRDSKVKNYKREVFRLIAEADQQGKNTGDIKNMKSVLITQGLRLSEDDYKKMYNILVAGDVKNRTVRSVIKQVATKLYRKEHQV